MHTERFSIPAAARRLAERLLGWMARLDSPEWATVMFTALLVGLGAGLGAVAFHWLIEAAQWVFLDFGARVFGFLGDYYIIVVPVLGGLIGGPLVVYFAQEAKGHGVPAVMEAVALRGGRIRPRVAVVKSLASSICIGSGGSVGSEGPIVQIGAALGSTIGQVLNLSDERIRSLVACGAAGGIAAVFNAPIAGTIFALEVILGEFRSTYFGAVVISAVIADVVVHIVSGAERAFTVPSYALLNPAELLLYALLGVAAALVAVSYSRFVDKLEGVFERWKAFPEPLKASVGGLLLGLLGAAAVALNGGLTHPWENGHPMPAFFGVGYEVINMALLGELALGTSLLLMLLKLLATGFVLGSGGSGGVFAPGLFIGAMLGSAFGQVANLIFPGQVAPVGAYALVGMAAVFAGAAHAPATSILILFEMTGDYNIILPLMFGTVVSLLISRALEPESIYTLKLSRRGIRLHQGRDVDLMEGITVAEVMDRDYDAVLPDMGSEQLLAVFEDTHHHGFPVVDEAGTLVGMLTLTDVSRALHERTETWTAGDIATRENLVVAEPHESLATAVVRMGVRGIGRLPVVESQSSLKLVGILHRSNVIHAYNKAIARRTKIAEQLRTLQKQQPGDMQVIELKVTAEHDFSGQALQDIASELPSDCIVASIQRGTRTLIPHGSTILEPGDVLTLVAHGKESEALFSTFEA
ncbi:MAG: chloride channel protein [Anaerolineae bacterium]|nr:chloride channel protein [Anaerolineae bacterium]